VHRIREEGFRAAKLRFRADDIRDDLAVVEAIRATHGREFALMVDANQGIVMPGSSRYRVWDLKTARYVADALADLGVEWLEEPLPLRHYRELSELTRLARLPIAGGELNLGLAEFALMIRERCYDIIQPDATYSEGIWGCRKIAAIAEAYGLRYIPHTWSNGLGMIANFHIAASTPNSAYLEVPYDPPTFTHAARDAVMATPLTIQLDGTAHISDAPGLGVELAEDVAALFALREC
jgi:L-alanine-DL-glutamate epimerase-like enolase superfamily enzyme